MQIPTPQIKVVEYNSRYASLEKVKEMFFENYLQHQNSDNFNGLYISMSSKYGKFTYLIMALPFLIIFTSLLFVIPMMSGSTNLTTIGISLLVGILANYFIFNHYMVKRLRRGHVGYGHYMLKNFTSIEEKYTKNGGNFWLTILDDQEKEEQTVIGQAGLVNVEENGEKIGQIEAFGIDAKYRGIGVGKKLLEKMVEFGIENKFDKLQLFVSAVNLAGVNLYKKYGFKIVKTVEVEKVTGISYHVMIKPLVKTN
jgi:RimJ/RimL family protein N-acetyltransferase